MADLNDLNRPVTTDTEPNVLDTLRAHIVRAATWSGWGSTANKVAGLMSATTAAVSGGRSLRLYRRNAANTADEEIVSLPGVSIGGNAATVSDGSVSTEKLAADVATAITRAAKGLFSKANPATVAWTKTGNGTAATATALHIEVNGVVRSIASGTSIVMPALIIGTDYNIWCRPDGSLEASIFMLTAPVAGARRVGGFHYSPGGNAAAQSGGDTTPQINEFSFWDLKWRPACADPRGMTLVAGAFWSDIYLLGVDHQISGSSRFGMTIADGSSPPKRPLSFGGNGSAAYGSFNWWEAAEVAKSFGKRLPAYDEFAALAYGTAENSSIGTDPGSTSWAAAYVSKWGVNQATGVLWTWGAEFSYRQDGSANPWAWRNNTGNRGQLYLYSDAALAAPLFGGNWGDAANSGSRASLWYYYPWYSGGDISARLVCDHLSLD